MKKLLRIFTSAHRASHPDAYRDSKRKPSKNATVTRMEIATPEAALFYEVYGNGPRHIFLFHGAGQDHTIFEPLIQALGPGYTCYAFDLFFHGQSNWRLIDRAIRPVQWQLLIDAVCKRHSLETFDVLGYSIGSRFALATLMTARQRIRRLILVAPDAITISPWYKVATGTAPGTPGLQNGNSPSGHFFQIDRYTECSAAGSGKTVPVRAPADGHRGET